MQQWGAARKEKSLDLLTPFKNNIDVFAKSVSSLSLHQLHTILSDINKACSDILSDGDNFHSVSPSIDKLMNQLISSAQSSPNPLLVENSEHYKVDSIPEVSKQRDRQSRKVSIGVVDHDKASGEAVSALISDFDFSVEYFESIEQLKEGLSKQRFDLVLLDTMMPKISTSEVFEFAKTLSDSGTKVISYSGLFNFEMRLAAVRAGVADFIVKPTSILSIIEKINRVLNIRKSRDYRIVYIDDQKSMGEFYQTLLEGADCEVFFMNSVEEMFNSIDDLHPDLFLLDMNMPDVNGLEAAKMIRQQKQFDFTPIVFLTADEQLDIKLLALQGGAEDVIPKSTPPALVIQLLLTRLQRSMGIREFVSKDSLTGVLNHGQIMEAAMNSYRLSKRQKTNVSIAMLDLVHFKKVNDTYGHAAGDKVLSGLGQLLSRSLRSTDFIGRYGGEEFMIVLVGASPVESLQKLNSIKDAFASNDFVFKDKSFRCTFSVGLADLANNSSLPQTVSQADQALYASKDAGRNRVTLFQHGE
ncbi:diguanylate cyclase [Glaciecola sp. MF2-115]|uniref:GGDEF domain-containing response regulator n=1 Tax=Glaciecola sp. MF2-115 TaxID=3384827 RepID=UPI0039A1B8ED